MTKAEERHPHHATRRSLQLRMALAYLVVLAAGSAGMAAVLVPRLRLALRLEMYRGHSTVLNTWEVLLPDVLTVNLIATAVVLVLAAAITVALLATVQRSARRLTGDVRAARDGGDPSSWEPLRRPREFRRLQAILADGIQSHRRRLAEIDAVCAEILGETRRVRAAPPGRRDLRGLHALCERLRSRAQGIRAE